MFACGGNGHGQLGMLHQNDQVSLQSVPPLPGGKIATMISCGGNHTVIVTEDGCIFACGKNEFGQLGLGVKSIDKTAFQPVASLPGGMIVRQIICGDLYTVVLTQDGSIFSCGDNGWGQLGLGDDEGPSSFQILPPLPGGKVAKQISCGSAHTMVVAYDGSVFGCGCNESGELGLGHTDHQATMHVLKCLPLKKTVKQVVCGGVVDSGYTILLCEDGSIFGCGANDDGQLGLGHTDNQVSFKMLPLLPDGKKSKQVVCGASHTIVISEDGSLFGAGNNASGQLGLGHTEDQTLLQKMNPLPGGKVADKIMSGGHHILALTDDGSAFGCGFNLNGALGLGHLQNISSMQAIPFYSEHPGFIPWSGPSSSHTFAIPVGLSGDLASLACDLQNLIDSIDAPPHANVKLIGSDREEVCVHAPMLRVRCPRVADRAAPNNEHASPSDMTIPFSETTGKTLKHLAHFMYTDSLPGFVRDSDSSDSDLSDALSLMAVARDLQGRFLDTDRQFVLAVSQVSDIENPLIFACVFLVPKRSL
mmetsp:Transcript_62319/g.124882  ORF Transcript_62319/g.124882 Transcript_62319/m.124882 type:complete len:532 (+) Transcript_62319:120-1715(+)